MITNKGGWDDFRHYEMTSKEFIQRLLRPERAEMLDPSDGGDGGGSVSQYNALNEGAESTYYCGPGRVFMW